MTRVISVLNFKGGTGKTTTVVNLAAGLALRNERVLCIDMDAQGNLGTWLGVKHSHTTADLLLGHVDPERCITTARKNLDVIVGDRHLMRAEGRLWRMGDDHVARRVLYYTMKEVNSYDYVIMDCAPSYSLVTENALLYARELIVPVSMDYLAMVGSRQVLDTLKTVGHIPDHELELTLVVPTLYYQRLRKDQEVMAMLQRYFRGRISNPIRSNVRLAEAASHQQTIYEYAPNSHGAEDYARLVEKVANIAPDNSRMTKDDQ